MYFSFDIPTKILITTQYEFADYIMEQFKDKNILFFISENMIIRLNLHKLFKDLRKNNNIIHISEISPNPTDYDLENTIRRWEDNIDTVIALGGGSVIDLAKATIGLSYLAHHSEFDHSIIKNEIISKNYLNYKRDINFIAIPTTAGTSSEITKWATIWDYNKINKMSVEAEWLSPDMAIVVPEFTTKLPVRLTLSTGLDALSHAMESYWSKRSNAISRELSKQAIRLISEYLPMTLNHPDQLEYREKICLGCVFAGLAFSNTRTTACHSISYPLTMHYGIEHGFAVALTLVEVMKINEPKIVEMNQLLKAFDADTIDQIQNWFDNIGEGIQSLKLKEFGVKYDDIETIARLSFTAGRMDNNPVELNMNDVSTILYKCY